MRECRSMGKHRWDYTERQFRLGVQPAPSVECAGELARLCGAERKNLAACSKCVQSNEVLLREAR